MLCVCLAIVLVALIVACIMLLSTSMRELPLGKDVVSENDGLWLLITQAALNPVRKFKLDQHETESEAWSVEQEEVQRQELEPQEQEQEQEQAAAAADTNAARVWLRDHSFAQSEADEVEALIGGEGVGEFTVETLDGLGEVGVRAIVRGHEPDHRKYTTRVKRDSRGND